MTEVADSTAAVITADYQGILALMFGDTIEQITTFSRKIFHQTDDSNDRTTTIQSEKDVAVAIAPTVNIVQAKSANRCIVIDNVPPTNLENLNYSILERIINHVKGAYIEGQYEDTVLKQQFKGRAFCFCMTYLFQHDGDNKLTVDFYISYTEKAPRWITPNNPETSQSLMTENEVDLIADAYVRQCARALQNYVNFVFNHSAENGTKPNYYSKQLPEKKPTKK